MSGIMDTVTMFLSIGGVEGRYRRIVPGKITRTTILQSQYKINKRQL
jgi:hypothetical protein